jgi:hypothetical protein
MTPLGNLKSIPEEAHFQVGEDCMVCNSCFVRPFQDQTTDFQLDLNPEI